MSETFSAVSYHNTMTEETEFNDDIFGSYSVDDINRRNTTESIFYDTYYKNPDYKVHVINTTDYNYMLLHSNNILSTVRKSNSFREAQFKLTGDRSYLTDGGVLIIEYFKINSFNKITLNTLLRHYNKVVTDNKICVNWDKVISKINRKLNSGYLTEDVTVRLASLIPSKDINRYGKVFLKDKNICILSSPPRHEVLHPTSTLFTTSGKLNDFMECEETLKMDLTLIDNKNPGKNYFINIMGRSIRIMSKKSTFKEDGLEINLIGDDVYDLEGKIKLDELEENCVWNTEEKAVFNSNSEGIAEHLKQEIESERLSLERDKMNLERVKIHNDIYKINLNKNMEVQKANMLLKKSKVEEEKSKSELVKISISTFGLALGLVNKFI